jgi:hypothetical protein
MNATQISFLKNDLVPLLGSIPSEKLPDWGNLTLQQMIEHLSDVQRLASGKISNKVLAVPEEKIPNLQKFLMSDKPFPQGVVNPIFPKDPQPVRNVATDEALKELQTEIDFYFSLMESDQEFSILHPYFGQLDKEMNLQAVYKHALHHLKQFGTSP